MSKKLTSSKRIESPIAKYNAAGQLTCIICNQVVKSELVWNAHINSKSHLEAKNQLKMKLVAEQAKPISTPENIPKSSPNEAKPKSNEIVNNKTSKRSNLDAANTNLDEATSKKQKIEHVVEKTSSLDLNKITKVENESNQEMKGTTSEQAASIPVGLPEGFFDDPELDAKARGQSREANLDAEYEEFKKMIQSEELKSDQLIEKDDQLRDFDRDIEEVDELIGRWNKIEHLHIQREAIKKKTSESKKVSESDEDDEDDEDINVENILNMELRSKKIL